MAWNEKSSKSKLLQILGNFHIAWGGITMFLTFLLVNHDYESPSGKAFIFLVVATLLLLSYQVIFASLYLSKEMKNRKKNWWIFLPLISLYSIKLSIDDPSYADSIFKKQEQQPKENNEE